MNARDALLAAASEAILVKDGPYGTAIQACALSADDYGGSLGLEAEQKGNNDLLNLTQPGVVRSICDSYIAAGARLLATNTFNANRISQADYGAEHLTGAINHAAARIVREATDAATARDGVRRFVAGAVGPTNKTLSLSPRVEDPGYREVSFDAMAAVYREQCEALIEGGADFILIETVFDTLNCKAAIAAVREVERDLGRYVPMMISLTLTDLSGRNLSGHTVEAFWHSVRHARPVAVGLNCSFGAEQLRPHVQLLSGIVDALLLVYPNAGLPNDLGQYDEAPHTTAALIEPWVQAGQVNIVGGCCGSTAAHIAAIAEMVRAVTPRPLRTLAPALRLAGLEPFTLAA
ncbi:5-methyltetrahydrofolate--homocysteine methyltransferase [Erythrobacteraceae bacterium CFH 75059]|uniref:homocysteine S-methyltransferase family protein n=1 Tax=Qipengyuania thermophila TaxID=2509361 RepID=UPI0010220BE3|nr:homocysteine S-methyltransferase family protein [Qipengyuania thermophila]TCD04822.1 5-methyltetrahydrofolate--homocysteine methyltransferase [Erythrobacteraceae bacterium CFH 75059]